MKKYTFYKVYGKYGAFVFSPKGISRNFWPIFEFQNLRNYLSNEFGPTQAENHPLSANLQCYFEGKQIHFNDKIDLEGVSQFTACALKKCQEIPFGEVRTYKWLALKINSKAHRAIGTALSKNPVPILIPCHRIVKKNGCIGGFSGPAGFKEKLIDMERKQLGVSSQEKLVARLLGDWVVRKQKGIREITL